MAVTFTFAHNAGTLPAGITIADLTHTVHAWMHPYADTPADTEQGIRDALEGRPASGGFILCAVDTMHLAGVLVMLSTGMRGYIPPNLLLFLAVDPARRRSGIGRQLVENALKQVSGPVKLHVETDNPARLLYEQCGFSGIYLDMRFNREEQTDE